MRLLDWLLKCVQGNARRKHYGPDDDVIRVRVWIGWTSLEKAKRRVKVVLSGLHALLAGNCVQIAVPAVGIPDAVVVGGGLCLISVRINS